MVLEAAKTGYTEIVKTLVEFTRNTNGTENPFIKKIIEAHVVDATNDLLGNNNHQKIVAVECPDLGEYFLLFNL